MANQKRNMTIANAYYFFNFQGFYFDKGVGSFCYDKTFYGD